MLEHIIGTNVISDFKIKFAEYNYINVSANSSTITILKYKPTGLWVMQNIPSDSTNVLMTLLDDDSHLVLTNSSEDSGSNNELDGIYIDLEYLDSTRMQLTYNLPLSEIIYNFFDLYHILYSLPFILLYTD